MDLFEQLRRFIAEIERAQPADVEALEQFRKKFVGAKNVIKPLQKGIRELEAEQRPAFGQLLNKAKQLAEEKYKELKASIEAGQEAEEMDKLDLTAPAEPLELGARHPVAIVMDRIIDVFSRIGFTIAQGPEIEDDWHNFTAMNTPEDHPARDMQDTYYLMNDPAMLLRTHTSSVQSRVMESQKPPIRIIAPGRVYRNETISARSHCQFHQVEGLYIDEGVSFADMKQTMLYFARQMYGPDARIRLRPSFFPFTEPSAEMDVYWGLQSETDYRITKGTGWLEILGCGMVDPNVLENCGIDPNRYSGFAFGMGIERQAMLQYRIGDIRLFFENDLRFLKQFKAAL